MVDVLKYQAGTYLFDEFAANDPARYKAEHWVSFDTFGAAFQWLKERMFENPKRTGRFLTHEWVSSGQWQRLGQLAVVQIG